MADVKITGMLESERTQALERFYVIRPFLEDGAPLAQIARERGDHSISGVNRTLG